MKSNQFKTNINCSKCIASVTPHLNAAVGEGNWEVDTTNPDKILTVKSEFSTTEKVLSTISLAGFKAEIVAP